MTKHIIIIDPGHGGQGSDTNHSEGDSKNGSIGFYVNNEILEKDITLAVSEILKTELSKYFDVHMTRATDCYKTFSERANIAKNITAETGQKKIFVSIHVNAVESHDNARGYEVYYFENTSKSLADTLDQHLSEFWEKNGYQSNRNPAVKQAGFAVLKKTKTMPGVLIEMAFIDNKDDIELLMSNYYRKGFVDAVLKGLCGFLGIGHNFSISGIVKSGASKKGIPNVSITASGPAGPFTTLSKSGGKYEVKLPAKGKWSLRFENKNMSTASAGMAIKYEPASINVVVDKKSVTATDVFLKAGFTF